MKYYIGLIILAVSISSCQKEIKVKLPDYQEQLFVFSNTHTGEPFTAYVRQSKKVTNFNETQDLNIKNATVMLYINDGAGTPVNYIDTADQYVSSVVINQGDKVRITVTAPNFPVAEAGASVPSAVQITDINVKDVDITDKEGNMLKEIRIRFNDASATEDHYVLDLMSASDMISYGFENNSWYCLKSSDASIEQASEQDPLAGEDNCLPSKGLFINDALFNGKEKELVLTLPFYFFEPVFDSFTGQTYYPEVRIKHISNDYYNYLKSTDKAFENEGNPFAEPVNVKTNIKNGYGVLAPVSVSSWQIK